MIRHVFSVLLRQTQNYMLVPSSASESIPADGKLRAEFIGDISRPHEPCDLSGLSPDGGDLYWSVGDTGGRLYRMRIPMDRQSGRLVGCEVVERHVIPGARLW